MWEAISVLERMLIYPYNLRFNGNHTNNNDYKYQQNNINHFQKFLPLKFVSPLSIGFNKIIKQIGLL